jgi:hypothetical protein
MKTYYLTSFWRYYSLPSGAILFWFVMGALAYHGQYFDFLFLASLLGLVDTTRTLYNVPTSHLIVSKMALCGITLASRSTSWADIASISHRATFRFTKSGGKLKVRLSNSRLFATPAKSTCQTIHPYPVLFAIGVNPNWDDRSNNTRHICFNNFARTNPTGKHVNN